MGGTCVVEMVKRGELWVYFGSIEDLTKTRFSRLVRRDTMICPRTFTFAKPVNEGRMLSAL